MQSRAKTDTLLGMAVACSLAVNLVLMNRTARIPDVGSAAPDRAERESAAPTVDSRSIEGPCSTACRADVNRLRGELQGMQAELLRVSLPHEAFALLLPNHKLAERFQEVVERTLSPRGAQRALQEVQCRGTICRISLRSTPGQSSRDDPAVLALRESVEIRSSLTAGFAWGPIQYARDVEEDRDVRIVPLYLALNPQD